MNEFGGFEVETDVEDVKEDIPDLSDVQPEFEEVFQANLDESQLGHRREGNERIGKPYLGKLAKSRLISARSGQLQLDAPPLIPPEQLRSNEIQEIAIQEFDEAIKGNLNFPIKIVRKFPDGTYEIWTVSDFKYYVRDEGRSQRSRQRKFNLPSTGVITEPAKPIAQNLEPVRLTEKQIKDILDEYPYPPGIGKTALIIARKHSLERIRTILENIKIISIPEAYEEFKAEIIQSIYESHIEPGTSVGITAGVSLGGPVTQLSLNSFHFAGAQSGVALAFQKVRDFLTGSKMNRTPQMKIYFKVPYVGSNLHEIQHVGTFDSIMAMRPELEQTMVSDVILEGGSRVLTRNEAEMAGVPQMIDLHSRIRPERFEGGATKFPLTYVIEMELNTYRMFTHKITMAMVARAIEGPCTPNMAPDALTCVWRSQIDGKMYILVDENRDYKLDAINQDMAVLIFLTRYVMRQFNQCKISGIAGIISIEPQEVNVVKGIYRIKASQNPKTPGIHYVYTNNRKTRWDGVSLTDIYRLIIAAGFKIRPLTKRDEKGTVISQEPYDKDRLFLVVEGYEGNLEKELNRRIEAAQEKPEKKRTDEEKALVEAASFYYALTNGTNMEEIVWRDDVDLFRTASNHSHEILAMLGIDAARIFLIFRFMQTLQDFSSYINPRHISLTFDLLCNLGIINSLSFVGINRRRIGPLAMASYERSLDVFVNACTFGDREAVNGVSTSIYVGQKSKRVGTSSIALEEDLTVIPRDRATQPTVDEDGNWEDIMEDVGAIEGTTLADIIENEDNRQIQSMSTIIPSSIDKSRLTATTRVTDQPQSVIESIIPSGATIMTPSDILVTALQKVTTGTGLIVEPRRPPQRVNPTDVIADIGETITDITSTDINTGLNISLPRRGRPQPPSQMLNILSSLQTMPSTGITVNLPSSSPAPERIGVPLSPTRMKPSTGVPLSPTRMTSKPASTIPVLQPVPIVRVPSFPQPSTGATESVSSFINLLPDLSSVTIPTSQQGTVQNVNMAGFMNQLNKLPGTQ